MTTSRLGPALQSCGHNCVGLAAQGLLATCDVRCLSKTGCQSARATRHGCLPPSAAPGRRHAPRQYPSQTRRAQARVATCAALNAQAFAGSPCAFLEPCSRRPAPLSSAAMRAATDGAGNPTRCEERLALRQPHCCASDATQYSLRRRSVGVVCRGRLATRCPASVRIAALTSRHRSTAESFRLWAATATYAGAYNAPRNTNKWHWHGCAPRRALSQAHHEGRAVADHLRIPLGRRAPDLHLRPYLKQCVAGQTGVSLVDARERAADPARHLQRLVQLNVVSIYMLSVL